MSPWLKAGCPHPANPQSLLHPPREGTQPTDEVPSRQFQPLCARSPSQGCGLGQDAPDDFAVDVGETVIAALEAVGQAFVVEPELVHQRGL